MIVSVLTRHRIRALLGLVGAAIVFVATTGCFWNAEVHHGTDAALQIVGDGMRHSYRDLFADFWSILAPFLSIFGMFAAAGWLHRSHDRLVRANGVARKRKNSRTKRNISAAP